MIETRDDSDPGAQEPQIWPVSRKANLFIVSFFPTALIAMILDLTLNYPFGWPVGFFLLAAVIFMIGQFFFNCPNCGKNVFVRVKGKSLRIGSLPIFGLAVPWSERTCSECGTDLSS
ncbi:MAG: hypothetical protein AAFW97_16795 [Pseudomonadota bacterium]